MAICEILAAEDCLFEQADPYEEKHWATLGKTVWSEEFLAVKEHKDHGHTWGLSIICNVSGHDVTEMARSNSRTPSQNLKSAQVALNSVMTNRFGKTSHHFNSDICHVTLTACAVAFGRMLQYVGWNVRTSGPDRPSSSLARTSQIFLRYPNKDMVLKATLKKHAKLQYFLVFYTKEV